MSNKDDSLEKLLSSAAPRPVPDEEHTAAAHNALRKEWRVVTRKRTSRNRFVHFAIAATVLVSVFSLFNTLRTPVNEVVQVASIHKSFGSIYFISEESDVVPIERLDAVHSGQKIQTGDDAGIALAWEAGGSLRIDAGSTIEFIDANTVYLHAGKVYFDSTPSSLIAGINAAAVGSFKIDTEFGSVSHVGTQFMTSIEDKKLRVSVREGRVEVDAPRHPRTANRGEQLVYSARQRPDRLNISEYGEEWQWVTRTSPTVDTTDKPIGEFLDWVGRELGREIMYLDEHSKEVADIETLVGIGKLSMEPEAALRFGMRATALDWKFDEKFIKVGRGD